MKGIKQAITILVLLLLVPLITMSQGALAQGITVYEDTESTFVPTTIVNGSFDKSMCFIYITASAGSRLHIVTDGDATGMRAIDDAMEDTWYSPDERKLSKRPMCAGMYICNGKKIVIK